MKLVRRIKALERGRVGDPIDPEYLRVAGQIHTDTSLGASPVLIGEGYQEYRLFCNRGVWGDDKQLGLLSLKSGPGLKQGEEEIHFLQVSRDGGEEDANGRFKPFQAVFRLEGKMRCLKNVPQSWELCSAIYDYSNGNSGEIIKGTDFCESVIVKNESMESRIDGHLHRRMFPASTWMSEWNLLRMIGRLAFGSNPEGNFCFLEGLSLQKPDAIIVDTGKHEAPEFGGYLYSFSMLGRGIVPFDFWLDADHRLVSCISGGLGRAYIPEALMIPVVDDFVTAEFRKKRN